MSTETAAIDRSKSRASFQVKKLGFLNIEGNLGQFSGTLNFDPQNPDKAVFDVCLEAKTIDTANAKRDEHLKSADFFDVEQYPKVCFKSDSVKLVNNRFRADGTLTMRGVSKAVSIPFSYNQGTFTGKFSLNRKDHGVGKKFPSFIVGNTIKIDITCKTK